MNDVASKVATLMEAMPYLKKYAGKVIVIKYGGNAMINEELKAAVLQDVVMLKLLGMKPVLSHGGGPGINKMLEKLDIPVQFINGLRYTSADIISVVEAVLIGQVNSELVGRINAIGGEAVGLSGISANIYKCVQRSEELGFVGAVVVILLFVLFLVQGLWMAFHAENRYCSLVGIGIMAQIAWQVFCNIAVVTNTLPNTGISLPFFSSGGTSLILLLAEMGVMINIGRGGERARLERENRRALREQQEKRPDNTIVLRPDMGL